MRNFVIVFTEKEGTTPLVHLLDGFESVSIVHQVDGGWEPFDSHNCGPMPLRSLDRCLRLIYSNPPVDMDALNGEYMRTAGKPLAAVEPNTSVGFKMRFLPPNRKSLPVPVIGRLRPVVRATTAAKRAAFRRTMFAILRDLDVTVFFAVRQDILRWGLSKYHGDGSGRPGHLQFALETGRIQRSDIAKIQVDLRQLESLLSECRREHAQKRRLLADLDAAGVRTAVLRYEDFLNDPDGYFADLLKTLEIEPHDGEIDGVLRRGTTFEKVHSDELAEFVVNHDEVLNAFGDTFIRW